ncbi:MAG: ribokinase [Hespellia sp.]|nr:ribokinase [Hespellia sp.]
MKVLNYGSLNYDYIYEVDHMVVEGETISSSNLTASVGGKGLNQSIALAKAGVEVYHGGTVGEDGEGLLQTCIHNGINTEYIDQCRDRSGHAIIQLDKQAKNCIILYGGANQKQSKEHIDEVLGAFGEGDMLLLQNEVNELPYLIEEASKKRMKIVLNPSPFDETIQKCDLNQVDYFILNEVEASMMTGEKDSQKALEKMSITYPNAKIVLTLGSDGVIYKDKTQTLSQKAYKVDAVDTTAAGDTFTGFFIGGIVNQMEMKQLLAVCAKASAITVSRKGAANTIPTLDEVLSYE